MDPGPSEKVSIEEIWKDSTDDFRRSVCIALFNYRGPDVLSYFAAQVKSARDKQLATGPTTETAIFGKRKQDEGDAPQPPNKKPRLAEAKAPPLNPVGVAPAWPALRQSPIMFGQPTSLSASEVSSPHVVPRSPAMPSTARPENPATLAANPASFTAERRSLFDQFASFTAKPRNLFGQPPHVKTEAPAPPAPDCDAQFTFADRRSSSGPQPYTGPGTTQGGSTFGGAPSAPPADTAQGAFEPAPVTTVYKPPFTGVDMSSLKVPANSNVSLTMNVFQAPAVIHQNAESVAPKKLRCIQCKKIYMEAQNTAMECRRHTGMRARSELLPLMPTGRQRKSIIR